MERRPPVICYIIPQTMRPHCRRTDIRTPGTNRITETADTMAKLRVSNSISLIFEGLKLHGDHEAVMDTFLTG